MIQKWVLPVAWFSEKGVWSVKILRAEFPGPSFPGPAPDQGIGPERSLPAVHPSIMVGS